MENQSNDISPWPSVDPEETKRIVAQMIVPFELAELLLFSVFLFCMTWIFFTAAYIVAETNPQIPSRIWVICGAVWSLGVSMGYSISLRAILQNFTERKPQK